MELYIILAIGFAIIGVTTMAVDGIQNLYYSVKEKREIRAISKRWTEA